MAISRTPYRISFFGGGTDYPGWYKTHGGAVLSMAINKYCYITGRHLPPFFGIKHRIVWSHIETVGAISEILHPAVREGLQAVSFDDDEGVELHHQGDLPARSGIGSSSAFAVGLINVLHAMRGSTIDKHALAEAAIDLEQNRLKEAVGCQDQIASAYGGFNVIQFKSDGGFAVEPIDLAEDQREEFERRLVVVYTGTSRLSSTLSKQLIDNFDARVASLKKMQAMVPEAVNLLRSSDFDSFGRLLHESWELKRSLTSAISTSTIDRIYDDAMRAGALGGKLLGAGGAGFMVFVVPVERRRQVREALSHLISVPVRADFTGSTIIYRQE
ncbi:kinase [Enhydrobacter aerosaccus]|nr:kinase [Enhydrobacter aerosaccus]